MKKCLFYLAISLLFNLPGFSQDLSKGLVGYWPFNGNANDESKNSNHGVVTNATLTKDRFGKPNSAYHFDGDADYIMVPQNTNNQPSSITLNIWFRYSDKSIRGIMFGCPNSLYGEWGVSLYANKDVGIGGGVAAGSNNHYMGYASYDFYNDSQWHMATMVFDEKNPTEFSFYIDACFHGKSNLTGSSGGFTNSDKIRYFSGNDWYFGAWSQFFTHSNNNGPFYFKGDLDDGSIYNRPLTDMEIKMLYSGKVCLETQIVTIYDTSWIYDTLVHYDTLRKTVFDTVPVRINVYDTTYITHYDTSNVVHFDTVRISVSDTLLIEYQDISKGNPTCTLLIYPNPNRDILFLKLRPGCSLKGYHIRLFNDIGQLVHHAIAVQDEYQINMSGWLAKGMYIVELRNQNEGLITRKKIVYH